MSLREEVSEELFKEGCYLLSSITARPLFHPSKENYADRLSGQILAHFREAVEGIENPFPCCCGEHYPTSWVKEQDKRHHIYSSAIQAVRELVKEEE